MCSTHKKIMTEVEKQESQKTVVAFITGLLIGGLLVWVFSSTPESNVEVDDEGTNTEQVETETNNQATTNVKTEDETVGTGLLSVSNQKAGMTVAIGTLEFPTKNGWVVVRDYMDGAPGNILGAARFSADEGLVPTSVELMRETVAGSSYQVVFFTNEGDIGFALTDDKVIDGIATTFKAN